MVSKKLFIIIFQQNFKCNILLLHLSNVEDAFIQKKKKKRKKEKSNSSKVSHKSS